MDVTKDVTMDVTKREERPAFTGLVVHRDLEYHYSLLYPDGWQCLELESAGGKGVILAPAPDDVTTSFSVEARDLGMTITGQDLHALRQGLHDGLRRLRDLTIERQEDYVVGALVGLEVWHTFRDGPDADAPLRKRWTRLAYQGSTQVRLIAQGADPAAFEYWLPMFTQAMRSFQFADWWAEVTGESWLPSLDQPRTE